MLPQDISVVIPAYNAEKFIVDALDSINGQSFFPGEVVVVNDGSSDGTYSVVQEWILINRPSYCVNLYTQKNCGISATRNIGIQHAKFQWIAFLDADDVWETTHLSELISAINSYPHAIAAYGAGRLLVNGMVGDQRYDDFWDNPSEMYGKRIGETRILKIDNSIIKRIIYGNFIKTSSLIF